jgi:hypothetical protein
MQQPFVATLATQKSFPDLRIFLKTLQLWNPSNPPTVFLYTDAEVANAVSDINYKGALYTKVVLQQYSGLSRAEMERRPGLFGSLWFQFMAEKIRLLEWVFVVEATASERGVFFFDSDICFFGPLPVVPLSATVALSPHLIKEADEARYGTFNGGFLWIKDKAALESWRAACGQSRFYEQAALEVFQGLETLHTFPIQHNFGWWRLWQGRKAPPDIIKGWTIRRDSSHSGIHVDGAPLMSIHTHFGLGQPADAGSFNEFVLGNLRTLAKAHAPARALLRILEA